MSTKLWFLAILAVSCLPYGCHDPLKQKQQDWHDTMFKGYLAADRTSKGFPPLAEEQLLAIIDFEPDLKVNPAEFVDLVKDDDPFKSRIMTDIWTDYCQVKRDLGQPVCDARVDRWQDSEDFKQAMLWVYDESYHFRKPFHHGEWLHCLFCGDTYFTAHFFFVRQGKVSGAAYLIHDRPLRKPGER